jgi:DNA repair protein RecO (recombination protein O)
MGFISYNNMKQIKVAGIIIKTHDIFEKDKIVEIFSEQYGRYRLLAKGANSSKYKYCGRIEIPNHVNFIVYKGNSFNIIQQSDLICSFIKIREDYNKISLLFHFFDIIRKATVLNQKNNNLFELLLSTIKILDQENNIKEIRSSFYFQFLKNEGIFLGENTDVNLERFKRKFKFYCGEEIYDPIFI